MTDPRIFFAAERTLLAWIRTGLTIIGMGFVVARFGLYMRLLVRSLPDGEFHAEPSGLSASLGVILVGVGAVAILVATTQFQRYVRTLHPEDLPRHYRTSMSVVLAYAIAGVGLVLAVYLAR